MSRPPGTPAVHVTAERTREAERLQTPPIGALVRVEEPLGETTAVALVSSAAGIERESASRRRRRAYRWIDRLRASDPELVVEAGAADANAAAQAATGPSASARRPTVIRVREVRRDFEYHYEYVYAEEGLDPSRAAVSADPVEPAAGAPPSSPSTRG